KDARWVLLSQPVLYIRKAACSSSYRSRHSGKQTNLKGSATRLCQEKSLRVHVLIASFDSFIHQFVLRFPLLVKVALTYVHCTLYSEHSCYCSLSTTECISKIAKRKMNVHSSGDIPPFSSSHFLFFLFFSANYD